MSRYIRTEIGIYEIDFSREETNRCYFTTKGWIYKVDVICQSDNLEDLCDEFILFDNENKIHYQSQEGSIWWLGAGLYPESVRGAIFTNEGIIYVAKYNKETEKLELI